MMPSKVSSSQDLRQTVDGVENDSNVVFDFLMIP